MKTQFSLQLRRTETSILFVFLISFCIGCVSVTTTKKSIDEQAVHTLLEGMEQTVEDRKNQQFQNFFSQDATIRINMGQYASPLQFTSREYFRYQQEIRELRNYYRLVPSHIEVSIAPDGQSATAECTLQENWRIHHRRIHALSNLTTEFNLIDGKIVVTTMHENLRQLSIRDQSDRVDDTSDLIQSVENL